MENLMLSLNVVLPLFLNIALGYILRVSKMCDTVTLNKINKLCFKIFLPLYLFNNIYTTDLSAAFEPKLLLFCLICLAGWFGLAMLVIPLLEKENRKRGVMIQALFRSNFALFGLPVAASLCGDDKLGPTSLLIGIIVPAYNVLAVITLEIYRGGKPNFLKILKGIVTNPLIIAPFCGVVLYLLGITLPYAVEKTVTDLGKIATPLSLLALGGSFTFRKVRGYLKQLSIGIVGKLILSPLLVVSLAILVGFRNEMLVPILIMFGAPTAVSSFTMAQQMDGDGELAAQYVVFTTALAILTIFVWIFVLKTFAYI